jgi:hypothetical protein
LQGDIAGALDVLACVLIRFADVDQGRALRDEALGA